MSTVDELEGEVERLVSLMLEAVAAEFTAELAEATEITAARFSVARVREMWDRKARELRTHLTQLVEVAAQDLADEFGLTDIGDLGDVAEEWARGLENRMTEVGKALAARAVAIVQKVDGGIEEIREALTEAFRSGGPELGPTRAARIAQSEVQSAWETGQHAAATRGLSARPGRMVKRWVSMEDDRVRHTHRAAHGQQRDLDEPFDVGNAEMMFPHDMRAPLSETINCRCRMVFDLIETTASLGGEPMTSFTLAFSGIPSGDEERLRSLLEAAAATFNVTVADHIEPEIVFAGDDAKVVQLPPNEPSEGEKTRRWSTPGSTGLAFEGMQTGDGRIFAAGALSWDQDRTLPLQYADEMLQGHQGAELVGGIETAGRDGARITGEGVLYASREAGADVVSLLEQDAPLGVSVDLDDVDVEFVIKPEDGAGTDMPVLAAASFTSMSVLPIGDGSWQITASGFPNLTATLHPDESLVRTDTRVSVITDRNGLLSASAVYDALTAAGIAMDVREDVAAAAGDGDETEGMQVVQRMNAGDALMRITRARMRGATLVAVPAFADARIVLTDEPAVAAPVAVAASSETMARVVDYVSHVDSGPVRSLSVSAALGIPLSAAREHLAYAVRTGLLTSLTADGSAGRRFGAVELDPAGGMPEGDVVAAVVGDPGLSIAPHSTKWDAAGAAKRVLEFAKQTYEDERGGKDDAPETPAWLKGKIKGQVSAAGVGTSDKLQPWQKVKGDKPTPGVDATVLQKAFLWQDASGDASSLKSYKIGLADVIGGKLQIVPEAVSAAEQLVTNSRLGVSEKDRSAMLQRLQEIGVKVERATGHSRVRVSPVRPGPQGTKKPNTPLPRTGDRANQGRPGQVTTDKRHGKKLKKKTPVFTASGEFTDDAYEVDGEDHKAAFERVLASIAGSQPDPETDELTASVWTAMRDVDPMPAAWFKEPTIEELPDGAQGVNYKDGRVFGWVARKGEPHAGYPGKRLTIESLGRIDTTHFLRAKFPLDDGTEVRAGAFTMNVGHHRDGFECETASCQFDDTRTVAAIVTVGLNSRGLWFSGAASPWLSAADLSVFRVTQPSYHMVRGGNGRYQLRAVLSVPVPGHSTPLTASAVIERSNLAIAAAASAALEEDEFADQYGGDLTHATQGEPDEGTEWDPDAEARVTSYALNPDQDPDQDPDQPASGSESRPGGPNSGSGDSDATQDVSASLVADVVAALTSGPVLDKLAAALATHTATETDPEPEEDEEIVPAADDVDEADPQAVVAALTARVNRAA